MERPVRTCQAGAKGVFQPAVALLHHAIRLRVEGGGWEVLDAQLLAEDGPYGRSELGAAI